MSDFIARFTLSEEQEPIKATFSMNLIPDRLSQLENDMNFVTKDEVNLPDVDFDDFATKQEVENISTKKVDISDFEYTIDDINSVLETKQPKGDYALKSDIVTYTAGENITIEDGVISASGGGSVDLTGYIKNKEAMSGAIAIGNTNSSYDSTAVGVGAKTGKYSTALGRTATANGENCTAIGASTTALNNGSIAIGVGSTAYSGGTALGVSASATGSGGTVAIGGATATGNSSIAVGWARATATNAIQLGQGENSTSDTFQVWNYKMLDKSTGKIPIARLPIQTITQADYDALTTKDANTLYLIEE